MKKTNILFVHPLVGNAYELYKAFNRNPSVHITSLLENVGIPKHSLWYRIRYKLKLHQDVYDINNKLLMYDFSDIDIAFVVKGNEILPSTLKKIKKKFPNVHLIHWSLDDMSGWHTKSIFTHFSIKFFDTVFTTKTYNIEKLVKMKAKRISYTNQAYSKDIHIKPVDCNTKFKHDVLFIGRAEKERFKSMEYLAENGIKINIYGTSWNKPIYKNHHSNLIIHDEPLYNENYAYAIACSKVVLSFLSKINNDLHTSRSVEIPACGGFMLAERTSEHIALFEEDQEAVYFSSDEELLEKVQYYLQHEIERKQIAVNGLSRCVRSGYSYDDMAKNILMKIND